MKKMIVIALAVVSMSAYAGGEPVASASQDSSSPFVEATQVPVKKNSYLPTKQTLVTGAKYTAAGVIGSGVAVYLYMQGKLPATVTKVVVNKEVAAAAGAVAGIVTLRSGKPAFDSAVNGLQRVRGNGKTQVVLPVETEFK